MLLLSSYIPQLQDYPFTFISRILDKDYVNPINPKYTQCELIRALYLQPQFLDQAAVHVFESGSRQVALTTTLIGSRRKAQKHSAASRIN